LADHEGVSEVVEGAGEEASVVAHRHEVGGTAAEAGRVEARPAAGAGLVAEETPHGRVGVVVPRIAQALTAGKSAAGQGVAEEAVGAVGALADRAGIVAGSTAGVTVQTVVRVEAGAVGIRLVEVVRS
jgi:hypothetical protein